MPAKKKISAHEQRRLRTQQLIFSVVAVIVIISWVLMLIAK